MTANELTEVANAERLVRKYNNELRYVPQVRRWYAWDGARWVEQADDARAIRCAVAIADEIPGIGKEVEKFRTQSLTLRGVRAAVGFASAHPDMRLSSELLDARAFELNTPSGIVDLRTGQLLPHDPQAWHSKITAVPVDFDLLSPQWNRFLDTTFQFDTVMIGYMRQLFGLAAIGEVLHHIMPFFYGSGNNGKTVILETTGGVLGKADRGGYASTQPAKFLVAGRDRHETEIAQLKGARMAVCSETGSTDGFDEAKIKLLTGGDMLTGRRMRCDFETFKPSHTLFLAANHKPRAEGGGNSLWRRVKLVPFMHQVPDDEVILGLADKLINEEGPAILAWMVHGAVQVITEGLTTPLSVQDATGEYAADEDHVGQFLNECCAKVTETVFHTSRADVYQRYGQWCKDNGFTAKTSTSFAHELVGRGYRRDGKSNGQRTWPGLKLNADPRAGAQWFG